ncbi:putative MFS monocarboxylate transporter [Macrophomina phaseolina]|uniref:MFS monocarboxylate transporter n=1 Tax=Macrophomina phaseolina TaxID=35725 RepID=A0ABQ8FRN7_9PEZI|nr:putative MFS monocarboxylate transporter [Macrophomina phaseolina]
MASDLDNELARLPSSCDQTGLSTQEEEAGDLPPSQDGKDAWLMLASAFLIEGFDFYSTHEPFQSDSSHSAVIGTVALGVMYLGSPIGLSLLQRWPAYRRPSSIAGLMISSGALALSSFATHVWQLILTQGVLWAIGASLLYHPILLFIDEWFVRRKGLAYGIMWAGTAISGATVPYVYTWLLSTYSYPTAMRVWSIAASIVPAILLLFAKPRLPVARSQHAPRRNPSFRFVLTRRFLFYQLGNTLQGLGYFIPSIYLPSYARSLGLNAAAATTPLALVNLGAFIGSIAAGALCDSFDVSFVVAGLSVGAAAASFLLWGLSGRVAVGLVYVFAVAYGLSAGSFASTWPGVIKDVAKGGEVVLETGPAFGLLGAGRGIGSIASGPLSEALLRVGSSNKNAAFGYGTEYGSLIIFTGVAMLLGGTSFGARRLGLM